MRPLLYVLFSILFLPLVKAAEWKVDATVKQNLSFDDNVRMSENPKGSFIYKLIPTANFSYKTETVGIDASITYGIQRFLSIKELDRNFQKYSLNSYYATERSNWGLNLLLSMTPARDSATQDSGDFDTNAEKLTRAIAPFFSYNLTELDTLSLSPSYSKTSFSSDNFSDHENSNITLGWKHQWTTRYSNSISLFYSRFDSISLGNNLTRKTKSDSYGANLSSTYWWTENLKISSTWGVRMTSSENTLGSNLIKSGGFGFLSDTEIKYRGENYLVNFNFSRSLVPSNRGSLNEQNRISLNLNYDLSKRLSTRVRGSYQSSKSASSNSNETRTRENLLLQSSLNWKMARDWTISASYRYRQQDRGTENSKAASNSFMLSINYNWQGLRIAR